MLPLSGIWLEPLNFSESTIRHDPVRSFFYKHGLQNHGGSMTPFQQYRIPSYVKELKWKAYCERKRSNRIDHNLMACGAVLLSPESWGNLHPMEFVPEAQTDLWDTTVGFILSVYSCSTMSKLGKNWNLQCPKTLFSGKCSICSGKIKTPDCEGREKFHRGKFAWGQFWIICNFTIEFGAFPQNNQLI